MAITASNLRVAGKTAICIALLTALVMYFAEELVPTASLATVFTWVAGIIVLLAAAVALTVIAQGTFNQWVFRKGGIDPQWLWFREDPPGTTLLREKKAAPSTASDD